MKTAKLHSPFDCHNYSSRRLGFRRLSRQLHLVEVTFPTSLVNRWKKTKGAGKGHARADH